MKHLPALLSRLLSAALCLGLLVAVLPFAALAEEEEEQLDMSTVLLEDMPDSSEVDERMDYYLKSYHAAGASVLVSVAGELVYAHDYGYSYVKGEEPITENSWFKVASVTKMISAIRVMQLVEQGVLDLDQDISAYLGYTVRNPYSENTPITLRMLMSHTSSLSPKADNYHPDWGRISKSYDFGTSGIDGLTYHFFQFFF